MSASESTLAIDDPHYTSVAKYLHWFIAGLIVVQFVLAKLADNADDAGLAVRQLALLANHKSVGITILGLAVLRVLWRVGHKPPPLPASMPTWQTRASDISHWSLYILIFALPITGWLMSSASAYSVSWFNLIQLPDFVAPSPALKATLQDVHETLAYTLLTIATLHILAALKHAIIDKDNILRRMSSAPALIAFAAIIVVGIVTLGVADKRTPPAANVSNPGNTTVDSSGASSAVPANDNNVAPPGSSSLPLWNIDYDNSFIHFTGDQAGAGFTGVWKSWTAEMHFDPNDLATSSFNVVVKTSEVETKDDDRDTTLSDPEWFDSMKFPEATFRANAFAKGDGNSYNAAGNLTIKGISSPATLNFSVVDDGNKRVLSGSAQLDRLKLGVGTGEWEDTESVGQNVTVNVKVIATVAADQ